MIRAFVVYEDEPEAGRFEEHAALCRQVPDSTFRHGRIFNAPVGDRRYRYYAEWEFADIETFRRVAASREFARTGEDAMEMGIPFHVYFADVG